MSENATPSHLSPRQLKVRGWALSMLVALGIVLGVKGARFLTPECERGGCPELEALRDYTAPEPARIYDEKGSLVGQLPGPTRIVVGLDEIPRVVRDGYIAVEDRRFRSHPGVDMMSALRALTVNLRAGSLAEGGSTITMQLARNLFEADVARWNPFRRKLAEIRIARMLEDQLSKDEILELYLNQIYLGDGIYGVEAASRHYFGTPVSRVGIRQAALLIGLAKNPEGYDPRQDLRAADQRIETVLDVLTREEVISADEAERARAERVVLASDGSMPKWGKNAYYLAAVNRELRKIVRHPAQRSGLHIFTGLDVRAQAAAVDALATQIDAIEGGRWGPFDHERPAGELERMDASPYLQGMVVAMDPATGLVTTLVGGRDYHHSEFDRVFQARRQPGSAFEPLVYAVALGRGVRLSDRISTAPVRIAQDGAPDWEPSDRPSASELSVRAALIESSSRVAVRLGRKAGVERVAELARRMGISTEIPSYPSVFIGSAEVIPAELVAAFAAVGNGGRRVEPHLITRVVDPDGAVIYQRPNGPGRRVLDERVAFLLLDVLREVVREGGLQGAARALSFPVAGKSGTTTDARDVWFVGMTPSLVAGVWLGFDSPKTIVRGGEGGDLAAPVWARFMRVANGHRKAITSWDPPPGVERLEVDALTGLRITSKCPTDDSIREYYLRGSGPANGCRAVASRQTSSRRSDPPGSGERSRGSEEATPAPQPRAQGRPAREAVEAPAPRPARHGSNPINPPDSVSADSESVQPAPSDSIASAPTDSSSSPAAAPDSTAPPPPTAPTSGPPIVVPPAPDSRPVRPDTTRTGPRE
jgi:penicillin-binding protein 1A